MASLEWGKEAYKAEVLDGNLQCTSSTGVQGQISLADIIGVLPDDSTANHQVLFVARNDGEEDSNDHLKSIKIESVPADLSHAAVKIPGHLQHAEPVHIVVSTRSGTGAAPIVLRDIVQPFCSYLGIDHRIHETQSAETLLQLSRTLFLGKASAGVPQTIILLSGDGGLVDIVDIFYNSLHTIQATPNIALIPCGTGNAMASSIGLISGPASGLKTLLRGRPAPIPIFAARLSPGSKLVVDEGRQRVPIDSRNGSLEPTIYGAVVASWGLHAALVADSDTFEYRKFGAERFKMAANELLYPANAEPHRFRGKISLRLPSDPTGSRSESIIESEEHMYVLASLVPRLEKDFLISPASEPLDGKLRFLRFGPLPADEAMRLMTLAYQEGQHVQEKTVTYKEVDVINIQFQENQERWRRVCIDGKIVAVEENGWMELHKEPRQLLKLIHS